MSNFKVLSLHLPEGTEENHRIMNQDCWSPCCNSNLGCLEYETGCLTKT
jgi:hypothetical protein